MSIALMTQAWRCGAPAGQKMVLLALCDNANDQGECYPSMAMLVRKCSMSERSVQGHLRDMEKLGVVTREYRTGRSTLYQIDPRKFCTPAESAPPQNLHPTPAESAPPPPQNLHPTPAESAPITTKEPSIEPSKKQKPRGKAAADDFDALQALLNGGVEERVAKEWLTIRKAKRAPLTQTALDGVIREAAKAGLTLAAAVKKSVEKGWQGFEAAWLAPTARGQQGGGAFNPTAHINRNRTGGGQ